MSHCCQIIDFSVQDKFLVVILLLFPVYAIEYFQYDSHV